MKGGFGKGAKHHKKDHHKKKKWGHHKHGKKHGKKKHGGKKSFHDFSYKLKVSFYICEKVLYGQEVLRKCNNHSKIAFWKDGFEF